MNNNELDELLRQISNIIMNKPIVEKIETDCDKFNNIQEAIMYLSNNLLETNEFLKQLSMGNLDTKVPGRHNFMSSSLKGLHADLNHLTWQANQVASGDYSQKVRFLGDLSVSFNQMIIQLSERETRLKEQSNMLNEVNTFMMSIMDGLNDWIIVTNRDDGEIIYANKAANKLFFSDITKKNKHIDISELMIRLKEDLSNNGRENLFDDNYLIGNKVFKVRTFSIRWDESLAYVHYIVDVTCETINLEKMEKLAYKDELTNLYNRRYCLNKIDGLLENNDALTFCMIDIDGLKFANDNYGHAAGDQYLKMVAQEMTKNTRDTDIVCRFGGDEFAIVFTSCSEEIVVEKMENLNKLLKEKESNYLMSVSYGIVYVQSESDLTSKSILEQADEKMYVQKKIKKSNRMIV